MLIATLTPTGAGRVLDGYAGQALPVHHAFRRTDGGWVVGVADFRHPGTHIPFQCWSLSPGDYSLSRVTYDGAGYTNEGPVPDAALAEVMLRDGSGTYLERFPEEARPFADRAYTDGFLDGVSAKGDDAE